MFLSNISFQIPIGITFIILIIWRLLEELKNKKEKVDKSNRYKIVLIVGILIAIILGVFFYKYEPIDSLENKGGSKYLMSYTYDSFIIFDGNIKYEDSTCLSTFNSIFPIGLIIGFWYIFKEETKHSKFIVPTEFIGILELILIVSNKTISFIPSYIIVLGFNLLQIYMIIYIFSRIEERLFSLKKAVYIALVLLVMVSFMPGPSGLNNTFSKLSYMAFILEGFLVLNYSDKRVWRLSSWIFTLICFFEFIVSIIVKFM